MSTKKMRFIEETELIVKATVLQMATAIYGPEVGVIWPGAIVGPSIFQPKREDDLVFDAVVAPLTLVRPDHSGMDEVLLHTEIELPMYFPDTGGTTDDATSRPDQSSGDPQGS
jgi:hypothetical protein